MKPIYIANFSGGKDSTYLLLELIRRGLPLDLVLNVDTGMEFPAMYRHIDRVERELLVPDGLPLVRLKAERSFEEWMLEAARPGRTPGYGWPGAMARWCTGQLKLHIINNFSTTLPADVELHQYIGFAVDEQYRLKRKTNQSKRKHYPLVEWGITEAQALEGCRQAGYTWDGLYDHFSRVSCWCCPLQSLDELRALYRGFPELWAKLRALDDRALAQFGWDNPYARFRPHESVRMLERRFQLEQAWSEAGESIRSRKFYRALDQLYVQAFILPERRRRAEELLPYVTPEDVRALLHPESPQRGDRGRIPTRGLPSPVR